MSTVWLPSPKGVKVSRFSVREHFLFFPETEGQDWCRTEAQAREVAEQKRLERIAFHKKQLAIYEDLGPHNASATTPES